MEIKDCYNGFYRGKKVLVTGHTGFKGSWLSIWLHEMGAEVIGYALGPNTKNDNFVLSKLSDKMIDIRGDIRDKASLAKVFAQYKPEIVFHLAAQPLVRLSYEIPVETYEVNLMGTLNVLEEIRKSDSVKVGIMVTTDKCYDNKEQIWGYREIDALGGYDPYSSSKSACEIAISSWRNSFFNPKDYQKHKKSIASVRAGNVIGGGDWAKDRIIPDCIRALESGEKIEIRNPNAVRPWQHVLDPLSGYLLLSKKMWENPLCFCEAWNFGPTQDAISNVWDIAMMVIGKYGKGELVDTSKPTDLHETNVLMLDITKSKYRLGWEPRINFNLALELTVDWYKKHQVEDVFSICKQHIQRYLN